MSPQPKEEFLVVRYQLPIDQVNLVLEGLGHLPIARAGALFDYIRGNAQAAVQAHLDAAVPATEEIVLSSEEVPT